MLKKIYIPPATIVAFFILEALKVLFWLRELMVNVCLKLLEEVAKSKSKSKCKRNICCR